MRVADLVADPRALGRDLKVDWRSMIVVVDCSVCVIR